MRRLRRFSVAVFLALSLLVGQASALLHALGHATDPVQQDSLPSPAKCADHSLYAAFGGAVAPEAPVAPFVATSAPAASIQRIATASLPPRYAFHSRAPPTSPA